MKFRYLWLTGSLFTFGLTIKDHLDNSLQKYIWLLLAWPIELGIKMSKLIG